MAHSTGGLSSEVEVGPAEAVVESAAAVEESVVAVEGREVDISVTFATPLVIMVSCRAKKS